MKRILFSLLGVFFLISTTYADTMSLGDLAHWAIGPINGLGKVFGYMCFIGGIGMILGAFLQYRAHKENPSQIRLTTPIFLLVVGLILLVLPFIGLISGYKEALVRYY